MYDYTSCANFFVHLAVADAFTLLKDCI